MIWKWNLQRFTSQMMSASVRIRLVSMRTNCHRHAHAQTFDSIILLSGRWFLFRRHADEMFWSIIQLFVHGHTLWDVYRGLWLDIAVAWSADENARTSNNYNHNGFCFWSFAIICDQKPGDWLTRRRKWSEHTNQQKRKNLHGKCYTSEG